MTVRELIEKLQALPDDAVACISWGDSEGGYGYQPLERLQVVAAEKNRSAYKTKGRACVFLTSEHNVVGAYDCP